MRMDRRKKKELTRMELKMDYLLIGMRTERSTLQGWKKDGKWTEWKVNGQKWKEVHYKDGQRIF